MAGDGRPIGHCVVLVGAMLTLIFIGGCVAPILEGANVSKDKAVLSANREAAEAGDPEAQYKVGDAYCCSPREGGGFYNNKLSTEWLCKSAQQGYAPAQYRLGQIYSGDMVDGIRILRRVATAAVGSPEDRAVAATWFALAAQQEQDDAAAQRDAILGALSDGERQRFEEYLAAGQSAPCRWDDVYGVE